jgi:phosphodiesterase/alkaline phosphatase D-like protein
MILDDHEVDDDWRWTNRERTQATLSIYSRFIRWLKKRPKHERYLTDIRIKNAIRAYWEHQGMHAPEFISPPRADESGEFDFNSHSTGSFAYCFNYGAAAFFVMDTRTNRIKNLHDSSMLGRDQWKALKEWLLIVRDKFPVKFLVSSSSVLYSMFGDFLGDRWSGFKAERDELLDFIGNNRIENLYLLAGDLHSAHSMTAECGSPESPVLLHEFCSTPFEQKCNKYARILYTTIKTGAIRHPHRSFVVTRPNFGKVKVRFRGKSPEVTFSLYGTNGELLSPK